MTNGGKKQTQLVAHVVNQYCHPKRSFSTCPDFTKDEVLPRSRRVVFKGRLKDWFMPQTDDGGLGITYVFFRDVGDFVDSHIVAPEHVHRRTEIDHEALRTLLTIRKSQREELIATLTKKQDKKLSLV